MLNLLKADFNKILQTRFVHILFLIIVTFPLLSMLFFLALDPSTIDIDSNGYALIIDSYHPNNNAGLLIGIMACVITCQEFSYGTIRNKMISGHKRWHIYLSLTLSTVIMTVPFFLINVLLNGLLGSFILGYGRSGRGTNFIASSK